MKKITNHRFFMREDTLETLEEMRDQVNGDTALYIFSHKTKFTGQPSIGDYKLIEIEINIKGDENGNKNK